MKKHLINISIFIGIVILGFGLWAVLSWWCNVPSKKAKGILEQDGYTDIELEGYAWFDCSESDKRQTKFKAKKPFSNKEIEGAICCGRFAKACTVRIKP